MKRGQNGMYTSKNVTELRIAKLRIDADIYLHTYVRAGALSLKNVRNEA